MFKHSVGVFPKVGVRGGLAAAVMLSTWSLPSLAQEEPDAATTAAARQLAIDGIKLATAGDCEGAAEKLRKAQELYESPVVASRLAECEIDLGRLVEGTERLRKMLRKPVPENASPAVHKAFARAKVLLDEATPRLAALNITVVGPSQADSVVLVNGQAVPAAALGVAFPANPGRQLIEVSAPGYYSSSDQVVLSPGETTAVSLTLRPEPKPEVEEASPSAARPSVKRKRSPRIVSNEPRDVSSVEDSGSPSRAPAYLSLAVGVVGLGVGTGFGFAAKSDYDALEPECPSGLCPTSTEAQLEAARRKGTIATIGMGVGAAGLVLGTIFLLTGGSSDDGSPAQALGLPDHVRTWVGVNEVGVMTRF